MNEQQLAKVQNDDGFVAALDQSGGSTPKALGAYGVEADAYSDEGQMYDLIHEMRTRMMTSPAFSGEKILGTILFEHTMDREVEGKSTPSYLWETKSIVPFLKVDKGLADENNSAQVMKPNPGLDDLLARANEKGIFGTKMRSVIKMANDAGVNAVVAQQFEVATQILNAGLMPIVEPEVDINSPEKAAAEALLRDALAAHLDQLGDGQQVMLKLTLPEEDNFYSSLINHPKVARVVALSGGYSRTVANERLSRNNGMIASFSRALSEGLSAQQSDDEFDATISASISAIFDASAT